MQPKVKILIREVALGSMKSEESWEREDSEMFFWLIMHKLVRSMP